MTDHEIDEFAVDDTPGYKVGGKKTLDEYNKLDENDESLKRWKESLGLSAGAAESVADDPRRVVVLSMALEVEGRPDIVVDLSTSEAIENLKSKSIIIKEGVEYKIKIKFNVQHEIVSGLKYMHSVKKMGVPLDTKKEMMGSYGPSATPYEKAFLPEEAPSGMLGRGSYNVKSAFIDDDKTRHLEWDWKIDIKKDWN